MSTKGYVKDIVFKEIGSVAGSDVLCIDLSSSNNIIKRKH